MCFYIVSVCFHTAAGLRRYNRDHVAKAKNIYPLQKRLQPLHFQRRSRNPGGGWRGEAGGEVSKSSPGPRKCSCTCSAGASRSEVSDPWLSEVEKETSAKWSLCFAELGTGWNCSYFSVSGICGGEQKLKRESVDKMIRKLIRKRMLQRTAKRSLEKKQRKTWAMTDTPPGMWDYNISCHFPRRGLR